MQQWLFPGDEYQSRDSCQVLGCGSTDNLKCIKLPIFNETSLATNDDAAKQGITVCCKHWLRIRCYQHSHHPRAGAVAVYIREKGNQLVELVDEHGHLIKGKRE